MAIKSQWGYFGQAFPVESAQCFAKQFLCTFYAFYRQINNFYRKSKCQPLLKTERADVLAASLLLPGKFRRLTRKSLKDAIWFQNSVKNYLSKSFYPLLRLLSLRRQFFSESHDLPTHRFRIAVALRVYEGFRNRMDQTENIRAVRFFCEWPIISCYFQVLS